MDDVRQPVVDETWKRREGRERVRIGRVWWFPVLDDEYDDPRWSRRTAHGSREVLAVRCHPRHGGKWWWTFMAEFLARFDPEDAPMSEGRVSE